MQYPQSLPDYTNERLSYEISRLRYDSLRKIITNLAEELEKQARSDLDKGRPLLHERMALVVESLRETGHRLDEVWKICEPHS